jgi:hypothetical protein
VLLIYYAAWQLRCISPQEEEMNSALKCMFLIGCIPGLLTAQQPGRFSAEAQKRARDVLNSSQARYLSGTGRMALQRIAGELDPPAAGTLAPALSDSGWLSLFPRLQPAALGEVMVNNPDQDLGTAVDISTQSETALAGFGRTVIVAYNDSGPAWNFFMPPALTGYSRSVDGGTTFTDVGSLPVPPGGANFGDPGLAADRTGNFYASSIVVAQSAVGQVQTVGVYKSVDGGLTWPIISTPPPGTALSSADKPLIAIDATESPFSGNVYISWTSFGPPPPIGFPGLPILFSRSTDGGLTFSPPLILSAPGEISHGSEPGVGRNGEVYVTWIRLSPGPQLIMFARSMDGGSTFSPPAAVAPVTSIGFATGRLVGNFRVNSFPRIDVNPVNGTIYIVYASNPPGVDGADVFLTSSTDRGATWSPPIRLNDDVTNNDQFFPDVAVNGAGMVEVVWYDRRSGPDNQLIDVYGARVASNGQSTSPNQRLTSVSFPPAVGYDPTLNPVYMGDYIDIKALQNPRGRGTSFGAAWGDNRRSIVTSGGQRNDQDVFYKTVQP